MIGLGEFHSNLSIFINLLYDHAAIFIFSQEICQHFNYIKMKSNRRYISRIQV